MEIERKYLIHQLPNDLESYPCRIIEQGYLCTEPVIRIRRDNDTFELTYKSSGLMIREEYNLPLTQDAYTHLLSKIDGRLIQKRRYMIPLPNDLTIELDLFEGDLAPLALAEVIEKLGADQDCQRPHQSVIADVERPDGEEHRIEIPNDA